MSSPRALLFIDLRLPAAFVLDEPAFLRVNDGVLVVDGISAVEARRVAAQLVYDGARAHVALPAPGTTPDTPGHPHPAGTLVHVPGDGAGWGAELPRLVAARVGSRAAAGKPRGVPG